MSRFVRLLAASTMLCAVPSIAQAQAQSTSEIQPNSNGVPVIDPQPGGVYFRVPLANDNTAPSQPYSWNQQNTSCSTQCGTGTKTVGYQCNEVATGNAVASSMCTAALGAVPANQTLACTVYSGCSYTWVRPAVSQVPTAIGANPVGTLTCGQVQASFSPYCQRSDGTVLSSADNSYCINAPGYPVGAAPGSDDFGYNRTEIRTSSCTAGDFEWRVGNWSGWSSTCSDASTQTRNVTCVRKFDNTAQADSFCSAVAKPSTSQTQGVYSTCAYGWRTAPSWSTWTSPTGNDPLCSADATRVRAVWCERSNTANASAPTTAVTDSFCSSAGAKPSSTETGNYAGCTFTWVAGTWTGWSISSPNAGGQGTVTATRTRSVSCMRSDGTVAGSASCAGAQPGASEIYRLTTGAWSAYSSLCSDAATRVRSITCSFTSGSPATTASVANSSCSNVGIIVGPTSETSGQYGSCTYGWNSGAWTPWSLTNSGLNASRSRTVGCRRSDGTTVADSLCSAAGTKPAVNESLAVIAGSWSAWSSTCSASATQSRSVTCQNGLGQTQPITTCQTAGMTIPPATNGPTGNYGGCTFSWVTGAWGGYSSTCSDAATRTRSVQCQRSDGTIVADASCTTAKPATSETSGQYGSCTYGWNSGAWTPWSLTNSGLNASRSRTVGCRRSDGATVADSLCSAAGTKPAVNESLAWNAGAYGGWSSTCSTSSVRTRSVTCVNGGGVTQADSVCNGAGMSKPASSEGPTTITTGCTNGSSVTTGPCGADAASPTGYSQSATCQATSTSGTPITVSWTQCQGTAVGKMYADGRAVCAAPAPTYGQTCTGTSIGMFSTYEANGSGVTGNGGSASGTGIYNRNPLPTHSQVASICKSAGGTCVRNKQENRSEYGVPVLIATEYECFRGTSTNPAVPTGTPQNISESGNDWDYSMTENSFKN